MSKFPTKYELKLAITKRIDDLIKSNLTLLFCGINPGLYSVYSGYHFAHPGNRFWKVLFMSGFTKRLLPASEQKEILTYNFGITNLVDRPSARASELSVEEFIEGGKALRQKLIQYKPRWIAFVGVESYRKAFGKPKTTVGKQEETLEGVHVWVLPSPSGLNAHYSLGDLMTLFRELRQVL